MSRFDGRHPRGFERQPERLEIKEDPAEWTSIQDAIAYLKVRDIAFLISLGGRLGSPGSMPEDRVRYAIRFLESPPQQTELEKIVGKIPVDSPIPPIESQLKFLRAEGKRVAKSMVLMRQRLAVRFSKETFDMELQMHSGYVEKERELSTLEAKIAAYGRVLELLLQPPIDEEYREHVQIDPPEAIEEVMEPINDEEQSTVVEQGPEQTIAIFPPGNTVPKSEGTGESSEIRDPQPRNGALKQHFLAVGLTCDVIHGRVEEGWRRQEPYNAYLLRDQGRMVVVCDAYGAASFVFHDWDGTRSQAEQLLQMTKGEIQESGLPISRIVFPGNMMTWLELVDEKLALEPENVPVSSSANFSPVRVANELKELGLRVDRTLVRELKKHLELPYRQTSQSLDFEEYVANTIGECVQPLEGWMSVKKILLAARKQMKSRGRHETLGYQSVVKRLLAVIEEAPEEREGIRRFISRGLSPSKESSVRLESLAYIPKGLPEEIERKMRTYVSVELAETVIEELVEHTKRVGWKTANAIAQHFEKKMGPRINLHIHIRETAERLLAEDKDGTFASQKVRHSDQKVVQYNPALVSAILKELELEGK